MGVAGVRGSGKGLRVNLLKAQLRLKDPFACGCW